MRFKQGKTVKSTCDENKSSSSRYRGIIRLILGEKISEEANPEIPVQVPVEMSVQVPVQVSILVQHSIPAVA